MDHLLNTDHETAVCWMDLSCRCLGSSAPDELAAHLRPALEQRYFEYLIQLRGRSRTPARRPAQQNSENTRIKRQPLWLEKRWQ
jgi:hypothetical protein